VIEAIAEAVRQDGVVHGCLAAVLLGDWEVLEGGIQSLRQSLHSLVTGSK